MTRALLALVVLLSLAVPTAARAADANGGSAALIRDVLFGPEPICLALTGVTELPHMTVNGLPAQGVSSGEGYACYQSPSGVTGPARAEVRWGLQSAEADLRIVPYQTGWQLNLLTVQLAGLADLPGPMRFELALGGQHAGAPPQNVVVDPSQVQPDGTALVQVFAPGVTPDTPVLLSNAVLDPEYNCCERDIEISGKFATPVPVITKTARSSKVTLTFQLPVKWFCYGGFSERGCNAFFAVTIKKSAWKDAATGRAVQPTSEQVVPFEPPKDKGKRIVCDGAEHSGVWSFTYEAELPTTNNLEADLALTLGARSPDGVAKGTGYEFTYNVRGKDRSTFDAAPVKPNVPAAKLGCCETNVDLLAGVPDATPATRDGKLKQVLIDLPSQIAITCGPETEPRQPCRAFYEIEGLSVTLLDSDSKPLGGKAEATLVRVDPPVGYPCGSGEHAPIWAFRIKLRFEGEPASIRITLKALIKDATKGKSYELTMTLGKVAIGAPPEVKLATREIAPDK